MADLHDLITEVQQLADPTAAAIRQRFFKTGPGEYGEGDVFFGLTVPAQRRIAKRHLDLPRKDVQQLLASHHHEFRFIALAILVAQYKRADSGSKADIVSFYLQQLEHVDNWDLVDASAPYILGDHLKSRGDQLLDRLARSPHMWTRRVAIVATLAISRAWNIEPALRISASLLSDKHDLIRKAVGWALREVGIVDRPGLLRFLHNHYRELSRTTLRYAIEHLTPQERKAALSGQFPDH